MHGTQKFRDAGVKTSKKSKSCFSRPQVEKPRTRPPFVQVWYLSENILMQFEGRETMTALRHESRVCGLQGLAVAEYPFVDVGQQHVQRFACTRAYHRV